MQSPLERSGVYRKKPPEGCIDFGETCPMPFAQECRANLFQPIHQIELRKQAGIPVNVGPAVRAEKNTPTCRKVRSRLWD